MKEPIGKTARKIIHESKNNPRIISYNKKTMGKTAKKILSKSNPPINNNRIAMIKGYIYCIVNKSNGSRYIGQTVRNPNTRFNEHMNNAFDFTSSSYNTQFSQAIRTYGINNFELLILETGIIESNLDSREIHYIARYNTYYGGYNGTKGGGARVKTFSNINRYNNSNGVYNGNKGGGTRVKTFSNESDEAIKDSEEFRKKYDDKRKSDEELQNWFCMCCFGVFIVVMIIVILGNI